MTKAVFKVAISAMVYGLVALDVQAATRCEPTLSTPLHDAERIVHTLRVDKPGQARVFAADGSEYTATEVRWMNAELAIANRACTRGDDATAALHLDAVENLLRAH